MIVCVVGYCIVIFSECEMIVRVIGPRPQNVLFLIHEVIESLVTDSFQGVEYDFLVPCPDCIAGGVSNFSSFVLVSYFHLI